jgi:hypothetical protein
MGDPQVTMGSILKWSNLDELGVHFISGNLPYISILYYFIIVSWNLFVVYYIGIVH